MRADYRSIKKRTGCTEEQAKYLAEEIRKYPKVKDIILNHSISANINYVAKYLELQTQLQFCDRLREYPDLYSEEDYKRDLKLLAERANFKF